LLEYSPKNVDEGQKMSFLKE